MKRSALVLVLFATSVLSAQDQKATSQTPEAKPTGPCVILKRMGPADEITSHLYSFGIRGKQFQYVEGNLPPGISFHGRLTDHDARKILDKGGKIQILEPKYTPADLEAARKQCSGITDVNAAPDLAKNQAEIPAARQAQPDSLPPDARPGSISQSQLNAGAQLEVTSTPSGADVALDGNFVGNTPSSIGASSGDHTISVKKNGYRLWEKKIKVSSGSVNISADLEAEVKQTSTAVVATTTPESDESKQKTEAPASAHPVAPPAPDRTPSAITPTNLGTVSFESDPSGADVYVDDSPIGKAPITLNLKLGQHYIRMFANGYKNWSQQIMIVRGPELKLTAKMEKTD